MTVRIHLQAEVILLRRYCALVGVDTIGVYTWVDAKYLNAT